MGNNTSLPDLASVGLALPPATVYKWLLEAIAPFSSMDELAAGSKFVDAITTAVGDITIGVSMPRNFTTAP